MALFGSKKRKMTNRSGNCCQDAGELKAVESRRAKGNGAVVKVLGAGCKKCKKLEANAKAALLQLKMDTDIEHVTDFAKITAYGVMTTPALVYKEKVISYGKVLSVDEIIKLLQ